LEKERNIPKENRARIIMTTALNYTKEINAAFEAGSEAYAAKPINTEKLVAVMKKLKLIN
jgi:two-component system chemotaxis response regulator CheY